MNVVVTTGTGSDYLFTRLLKIVDELCDEGMIDKNHLLVQSTDSYSSDHFEVVGMMPEDEFVSYLKAADCVISHAGTGTVTKSLKLGKKVILFPRRAEYGEHMDDHQLDLCKLFESLGYVMVANNKEELISCLRQLADFHPVEFVSSNEKMNKIVKEFIEKNV